MKPLCQWVIFRVQLLIYQRVNPTSSTLQASVWSCSLDNSVEKTSMWLGRNKCLQVKIGWANAENGPLYTIWHQKKWGKWTELRQWTYWIYTTRHKHVMGKSISGCDNWRFYHRPFWIGSRTNPKSEEILPISTEILSSRPSTWVPIVVAVPISICWHHLCRVISKTTFSLGFWWT